MARCRVLPSRPGITGGNLADVRKSGNLPFARDSFGDSYFVDLTSGDSSRCPVMIYHHDGSEVELVSGSLAEFLE